MSPKTSGPFGNLFDDVGFSGGSYSQVKLAKQTHFRLSRIADGDSLDERTGDAFRWEDPNSYWGKVMLFAKEKALIVIPDVDCCTAWCLVKDGRLARPMVQPNPDGLTKAKIKRVFRPASAAWALLVTREWAERFAVPYFELNLNGHTPDMSFLEWATTMGGVSTKTALAAATRYASPRKADKICLDAQDVMRLRAAAEARAAVVAEEAASAAAARTAAASSPRGPA